MFEMSAYKAAKIIAISACLLLAKGAATAGTPAPPEKETKEYDEDMARVKAMKESLRAARTKDLAKYEAFANEIEGKWHPRDKVCHARLWRRFARPLRAEMSIGRARLMALG